MQELLKFLPSVKTLFILAAVCAAVVFGFKDTIAGVALAGNNEALSLILAFLVFFLVAVLGVAGFYAISKKELEAEAGRTNVARVSGSKKVSGKQTGQGGLLEVDDSEDVDLQQDSRGPDPAGGEDDKKKA